MRRGKIVGRRIEIPGMETIPAPANVDDAVARIEAQISVEILDRRAVLANPGQRAGAIAIGTDKTRIETQRLIVIFDGAGVLAEVAIGKTAIGVDNRRHVIVSLAPLVKLDGQIVILDGALKFSQPSVGGGPIEQGSRDALVAHSLVPRLQSVLDRLGGQIDDLLETSLPHGDVGAVGKLARRAMDGPCGTRGRHTRHQRQAQHRESATDGKGRNARARDHENFPGYRE